MKTPACRTSRESMGYKTSQTTLTLTLRLWPLTFVTLTLTLVNLTYDLWPWTTFSDTRLKTEFFTFLALVTLTFDLWPWPSNLSDIWWSLMCVPNFRSVGPMVWPWERRQKDGQTHTQTHGTDNITSSANVGGKNVILCSSIVQWNGEVIY